jgi:glyoxylase-like metal-dependent hydrolase (beta-lactamase superfamily II)
LHQAKVAALEVSMDWGGERYPIYPVLIWDDQDVVLVDTGTPGLLNDIRNAMEKLGVPFERLNRILITHQDLDHIGSLPEIVAAARQPIEVIAHEETKPYIEGNKRIAHTSPEDVLPVSKVDTAVKDGDVLPFCGGIQVIYTPGHTPDHTSFYLPQMKILIAGDASGSEGGRLIGPSPEYTLDMEEAYRSLSKLMNYEIEVCYCYHGGPVEGGVKQQMGMLLEERSKQGAG